MGHFRIASAVTAAEDDEAENAVTRARARARARDRARVIPGPKPKSFPG